MRAPAVDPIQPRPNDNVGIGGLLLGYEGATLDTVFEVRNHAIGSIQTFLFGCKLIQEEAPGWGGCVQNQGQSVQSGIFIRGPNADGGNAWHNVLQVAGLDVYNLGFDPVGVRIEGMIRGTVTGASNWTIDEVTVNGADIWQDNGSIVQRNIAGLGGEVVADLLELYHFQWWDSESGDYLRYFIDEGSPTLIINNEATDPVGAFPAQMFGTEDVDWQWVPPPPPLDEIGIAGLVESYSGATLSPQDIDERSYPDGTLFTWKFGYTLTSDPENGGGVYGAVAASQRGIQIRGPNAAGGIPNPNTIEFGAFRVWELGFDPVGVRLEVEAHAVTVPIAQYDVVAPLLVNGVDIWIPGQGSAAQRLVETLGAGGPTGGGGTLYYWSFETSTGDKWEFNIDEGAGLTFTNEAGDTSAVTCTMQGAEGVDWQWEPGPLEVGLISQADVNTRGRTDDAPYDYIVDAVATNLLGPSVVGGDGGSNGMQYVATTSGMASELPTMPDYDWPNADFTCCVRFKVTDDTFTGSFMTFGLEGVSNSPVVQQRWQATLSTSNLLSDDAGNTGGPLVQAGIVVGTEHVTVLRRTGNLLETFLDGVAGPTADVSALGQITISWGGWGSNFRLATAGSLDGAVYWSSIYDRALPLSEIELLDDSVNPYTDELPPLPPLEVGLVSQADVNTRGRTDDLPFEWIAGILATEAGTGGNNGPAAGDGGATGMQMVNSAGTIEFTPPDLSFLTGDWTIAFRMAHQGGSIGRGSMGRIYSPADDDVAISVGRGQFQGTTVSNEVRTPTETGLNDVTTFANSQNIERVWTLTRTGTTLQMYVDGVATTASAAFNANDFATMTALQWGLPVNFNAAWAIPIGLALWHGIWDRVLPLSEIELLDDTVNPFV